MSWFNSIEALSKLIPIAQILIVILTIFTIWASVHRGNLEKAEKAKVAQEIAQTKSVTGDLVKKNSDLKTELNETKTDLTKKNADLEAALTESSNRLSDLKKKTEPRSLHHEQKTRLAQLLPPPANFQIAAACRLMDKESCNYAEELIGIFRDLKWQVGPTNKSFLDDIPSDVTVAITEDVQIPVANQIIAALNKVGLRASNDPIRKESISGVQANTLYLIVGARKETPNE